MRAVVAGGRRTRALADGLRSAGVDVVAVVSAAAATAELVRRAGGDDRERGARGAPMAGEPEITLADVELLVVEPVRDTLTAPVIAACDRLGIRMVVVAARPADRALAASFGLRTVAPGDDARAALAAPPASSAPPARGRVVVVWGPAGAPGRTTIAVALAAELARDAGRVALVDADSHAPAVALALGVPDEGPGFAAACRQAARATLTVGELDRIAVHVHGMSVLAGINRPGRWPELAADRVGAALEVSRDWAGETVVDVSSSLERDEEIVSDLDGPRRNAATIAALRSADLVVAVAAADPIGIARFVRSHAELRALIPTTPVRVLVNRARRGPLGIDAHGQVRRTLARYAGIDDVWFAPADQRAVDAALLAAQPLLHAAGRSALTAAIRRFVGEAMTSAVAAGARAV